MNKKHCLIGVTVAIALALGEAVGASHGAGAGVGPASTVGVADETNLLSSASTFWSSGWMPISQDQTLTFNHNLGVPPEQLAVELWFWDSAVGGIGMNRAAYGGSEVAGAWHGAYWRNLTANKISVRRMADDNYADQVNVKIWVVPPPDYDSGWTNINQGQTLTFNHNQGVTNTSLSVSLWFSGTVHGIHHFTYGGLTNGTSELGAYWYQLTHNTVKVTRRPNDLGVEQVRVVVVQGDPPAYDSLVALGGWQSITQDSTVTFQHNLHWNPTMLLVRAECYESSTTGIHQAFAGGDEASGFYYGAHVRQLNADAVTVFREADDILCPQVRVVVYKRSAQTYLPLILRGA